MRVITLKAENVKRLRAIEITPEGDTVIIAGRNAQGKSSVLDAIWMALAGADGAKETPRPIRDGEEQASVELDLGDLIVTRRWTKAGTNLVVAAKDGARYSKPQTILDELIGKLSFDPLAFAEQDAKVQLRTLLDVVDLPFDPVTLDMQRKGIYDQRTEINREGKRLESVLSEIPVVPGDTPDEEVVASELASALGDLERRHAQREQAQENLKRLDREWARLKGEVDEIEKGISVARAELDKYVDLEDPEMYQQELDRIDETNAAVRAKHDRERVSKEMSRLKEDSLSLTEKLEAIDREKADAIEKAEMPLDGLSFDEEGVLYRGIPFAQVSDSERLRVSLAIAMALNPRIRVIRITDGSLLDSENMALIGEMASAHDFQVWIERVDETGEVGITIEDGAVAGA